MAAIRRDLGLDRTPVIRYFAWLGGVAQGDFGVSFAQLSFAGNFGAADRDAATVADQIARRFGNTIFLASIAAAISVPLNLTLGLLAALYRGADLDLQPGILPILCPDPVPGGGVSGLPVDLQHQRRPGFPPAPAANPAAGAGGDGAHIEMAGLKGVKPWQAIVRRALPNALAPIIDVFALNLAYRVTGVVVVKVVFVYPGIGRLFVDAVKFRDMPNVQACCLIFAVAYILLNLTADVMSIITNPRLRRPK